MATFNFPPTSRYSGIATASMTVNGQTVVYLTRRFLPSPDSFAQLQIHVVTSGERLDNIAAQYMNDPEAFWRIADANGAMRPEELTETIGRRLRITLPAGIPGPSNA
jgi:hypothetical protein